MAVQLDEAHAVFLGPGEGEPFPGQGRELAIKWEGAEFEVVEFDNCTPGFGPDPHVHDDHTDSFFARFLNIHAPGGFYASQRS